MEQQPKITALYCRLSKDDERGTGESMSIETQKTILTQYAKEHDMYPIEYYVDDGYTGLNFNRPGFQRMLDDIALGKIRTVITKDLSRLGRDHIQTGQYSEIYFPTHKVRYIAVNDGYDSENQQSTVYASIKTAINEFYSRDTSVKIKASFRAKAKEGQHHSVVPPFGYLKDPENKNHLIPDPETAPYVVKIYNLVLQGWGNHRIRDYLREAKVPCPSWIHHSRGWLDKGHMFPDEDSRYIWRPDTLRLLIRNEVYCGNLVYGKSETIFKTKKHPKTEPEKWIRVENTHEPLVSKEVWERANEIIAKKRQYYHEKMDNYDGPKNIFNGILKCADCGHAMTRRNYGSNCFRAIYYCTSYTSYGQYKCTHHKLFEDDLYRVVTDEIRTFSQEVKEDREKLIARISALTPDETRFLPSAGEIKDALKRLGEVNKLLDTLYEDHIFGRISDDNYHRMLGKYQAEQDQLKKKLEAYDQLKEKSADLRSKAERIADLFEQYGDFEELTSGVLNALIDKITVSEPYVEDGRYKQDLTIYYRFIGAIGTTHYDAHRFYKSEKVKEASDKRAARHRKEREEEIRAEMQKDPVGLLAVQ